MTSDDRLFALVRRISAIESQLITRRAFLVGTDQVEGLWAGEDRPDDPAKPVQEDPARILR